MRKGIKIILVGLFLVAPIALLVLYTLNTIKNESAGKSSNIGKIKLVTPVAIIDEITKKIEEEDIENAIVKINAELPDPNIPSSEGKPLIVFAAEKDYYDIVAALLQKGADPNKTDLITSETALIKAVRNQNFETVNILLTSGADPNLGTNQGITPLGIAIDLKNENLANHLLSSGATNGVSKEKLILYAFKKNSVGVNLMLAGGIAPNITDQEENTPLIIAAANGDLDSAKILLSYRANINAKNKYGMTPLLYAIKGKHKAMTEYLINNGANINISNKYGQNPLFWAAYYGDSQLVHNLLVLGANYKRKTRRGQTALQMAKALGHKETAKNIEEFIAYKNLPRDEKGNIILPKVNQNVAQTPVPSVEGADDTGAALMSEVQEAQTAKQEKAEQKSSTQAEMPQMPQMPGGADALSSMMGGAQGGNMEQMVKAMQSMGGDAKGSNPVQMQSMPTGANLSAEQLKQMGVPEDQIATIMQAQQTGTAEAKEEPANSNGFKPKDLSKTTATGRTKTQINKLQTSGK